MNHCRAQKKVERAFAELSDEAMAEVERASFSTASPWSKPLKWSDLLQCRRILIVSQAGSGKTYECQERQRELWTDGQAAFFVELAELATTRIEDLFSPDEGQRFAQWRASQSSVATFFLDSVDELKLTTGSFRTALKRLASAIDGQLARTCVVITSRPIPFDRDLVAQILPVPDRPEPRPTESDFAAIAMNSAGGNKVVVSSEKWRTVGLLPLSTEHILQVAALQGVLDPTNLLADIRDRNALEFAERPQDLIELCSQWRENHRVGSYREQVANDVALKLKPRSDRSERGQLSPDKAFAGASRLALAAILTRKFTFRHSTESDINGPSGSALDPVEILYDWTQEERATLLERALFGFASYGRVRFHHRSVIEYLAARRLDHYLSLGKPISAVKRLLFAETAQAEKIVRPSMRASSAWLAVDNDSIFAEICERDPTVLLDFGDPDALTDGQREKALSAYIERYGSGGWRGLHVPAIQVHRFATTALGGLISSLWHTVENPEVRELLLDLIAAAKIVSCADIAFAAALSPTESKDARLSALGGLAATGDARLDAVTLSLELDADLWPQEIARPAIVQLFPNHLSIGRLTAVLGRLADRQNSAGYINYHFPRRIAEIDIELSQLNELRSSLSGLVGEGVIWLRDWPHYKTCKLFLLPALAAACARQLVMGPLSQDLASSIALVCRLGNGDSSDQHVQKLHEQVSEINAAGREMLFWAGDTFCQEHHPLSDPWERLWASIHNGPIRLTAERDREWVRALLKNPEMGVPIRGMMLQAALRVVWNREGTWVDYACSIREEVADVAEFAALVDEQLKPLKRSAKERALESELLRRQKQQERRRAKDHASWIMFWREIANKPSVAFGSERANGTAWNLWTAMSRSGGESQTSGWDRPFLEKHFSKAVADSMRSTLLAVWRGDRPTLRSEREPGARDTYLSRWLLGLAAIAAESEDPNWATNLTCEEARLACRYAPIQLGGLPPWLDGLLKAHPAEVDQILGDELSNELLEGADLRSGGGLLRGISNGSEIVINLFRPRLRRWLDATAELVSSDEHEPSAIDRLNRVVEALQRNIDTETLDYLRGMAVTRLQVGMGLATAKVWLPLLMKLDPEAGTFALEGRLDSLGPTQHGQAVSWFAILFGSAHKLGSVSISGPGFTPRLLLRLVRASYHYVPPECDLRHEGAYSPSIRDDAQHARNALLGAILASTGSEGWAVKLELAQDSCFGHLRDRVLMIARERAAEEVDGEPIEATAVINLERYGEAPPRTRREMFRLLNDRLDDLDDLLLQDVSPREEWAAIADERVMRRAIARHLKSAANRAYKLDQEAVTADEKETDIRLRSVASDQQGIIESKIGEKPRSATGLREALMDQLVRKYMAADSCRAGCLVITVAKTRSWKHPDTGQALDLDGLIKMLNEDARRIMDELGGTLSLAARGLDLRPRLPLEHGGGGA